MAEQLRCLNCGHIWRTRSANPTSAQCPECRRHRVIDNEAFERAVIDLVHLLRKLPSDPLGEFSRALDHAREIVSETFPDPVLAGQAAFEIVREALGRLGFPRPPRLPPLP
jgi:hypothetical protein